MSRETKKIVDVRITNISKSPFTIMKNSAKAEFRSLTPEEGKELKPLHPTALKLLTGY